MRLLQGVLVFVVAVVLSSAAHAEQKLSDNEMRVQKGAAVVSGGYCSIHNGCGGGVGCRPVGVQCAVDVDYGWNACDNDTAPPSVPVCVYPAYVGICLQQEYYASGPLGCICDAQHRVTTAPVVLATHNTCG